MSEHLNDLFNYDLKDMLSNYINSFIEREERLRGPYERYKNYCETRHRDSSRYNPRAPRFRGIPVLNPNIPSQPLYNPGGFAMLPDEQI